MRSRITLTFLSVSALQLMHQCTVQLAWNIIWNACWLIFNSLPMLRRQYGLEVQSLNEIERSASNFGHHWRCHQGFLLWKGRYSLNLSCFCVFWCFEIFLGAKNFETLFACVRSYAFNSSAKFWLWALHLLNPRGHTIPCYRKEEKTLLDCVCSFGFS